jgi:hypothetical protein
MGQTRPRIWCLLLLCRLNLSAHDQQKPEGVRIIGDLGIDETMSARERVYTQQQNRQGSGQTKRAFYLGENRNER